MTSTQRGSRIRSRRRERSNPAARRGRNQNFHEDRDGTVHTLSALKHCTRQLPLYAHFVIFFKKAILCPILPSRVWTAPSLCSSKFWKIQNNFDPDGPKAPTPSARSNPTVRRGRNYFAFFKIFMNLGTELSTLSMGQSIITSHLWLMWILHGRSAGRRVGVDPHVRGGWLLLLLGCHGVVGRRLHRRGRILPHHRLVGRRRTLQKTQKLNDILWTKQDISITSWIPEPVEMADSSRHFRHKNFGQIPHFDPDGQLDPIAPKAHQLPVGVKNILKFYVESDRTVRHFDGFKHTRAGESVVRSGTAAENILSGESASAKSMTSSASLSAGVKSWRRRGNVPYGSQVRRHSTDCPVGVVCPGHGRRAASSTDQDCPVEVDRSTEKNEKITTQ